METSLHKQLKLLYAVGDDQTEVTMDGFRIDAISADGELIEIQHASLGALRKKTRDLLASKEHTLRIVKPILASKRITTLTEPDGDVKRSRKSPKRGDVLDIFMDLVHFSTVFPHPGLTLDVLLVESEEIRVDRQRPTRRGKKFRLLDQRLVEVRESVSLRTKRDMLKLIPTDALPSPFDTAELGAALDRPRWFAQKVAYCLRQTQAASIVGKRGNSQLYRLRRSKPRKKKAA